MNVNDPRWASIDAFVEKNRDNILRDITRLVAVPSVEGAPEPGAPFGPGPKAALAKALEIADELGLDTFNADSYIGWAETGRIADGQKFLATITHTDVVPEGNGWDADPYTVRVRDGWLLGRGVADDKGPSILCLYALKYLKDSGAALKYPVRALLGANEETNMHDVDYYAEHYPMPAFCFTPDAEFPVCNGEKGGFNGELVSPKLENGIITAFEGGVAHNAVPDRASCTVQVGAGALVQTEGVTFEAGEGGATVIRGWGKSGHAAMPEGTVNAISLIVNCLLKSGVCTPQEEAYLNVLHTLHADTDGSALGIAADDGLFDPLTIIGGTIEMADGVIRQSFDCRYPTNTDPEKMTASIRKVCGDAATLENVSSRVPFYIDADSPAIQTLINTYNDVTGEGKKPFTMGGGTYARHFPYAVSFGPEHTDIEIDRYALSAAAHQGGRLLPHGLPHADAVGRHGQPRLLHRRRAEYLSACGHCRRCAHCGRSGGRPRQPAEQREVAAGFPSCTRRPERRRAVQGAVRTQGEGRLPPVRLAARRSDLRRQPGGCLHRAAAGAGRGSENSVHDRQGGDRQRHAFPGRTELCYFGIRLKDAASDG